MLLKYETYKLRKTVLPGDIIWQKSWSYLSGNSSPVIIGTLAPYTDPLRCSSTGAGGFPAGGCVALALPLAVAPADNTPIVSSKVIAWKEGVVVFILQSLSFLGKSLESVRGGAKVNFSEKDPL